MKSWMVLASLIMIVSCGKKDEKKPDYRVHISKLEEASRNSLKEGTVVFGKISGSNIGLNEYTARAISKSVSKKTKSIILKIEGDEFYSLDTEEDLLERMTERKVVFQKITSSDMEKSLKEAGADVSSDENFFRAKIVINHSNNQEVAGLSMSQVLNVSIDLRATCNTSMLQTLSNIRGYVRGEHYILPDMHLDGTSSCDISEGALLTKEEMRKLELSNVMFCDDRGEEEDCSQGKRDMSYLVD